VVLVSSIVRINDIPDLFNRYRVYWVLAGKSGNQLGAVRQ
jgi:hypothetical protein